MNFSHGGKQYRIEFGRKHQEVKTFDAAGHDKKVKSRYPFTTVTLLVLNGVFEKVAEATVGCLPTDPYSPEDGRVKALQKLNEKVDRTLLKSIWEAYHSREKQGPTCPHCGVPRKAKKTPSPTGSSGSGATPVITPMMALDIETPINSYMVH